MTDSEEFESVLAACEAQLATGATPDLSGLGFWKVVGRVKRDSRLIDRYADRIGIIDRRAFEGTVGFTVPTAWGTTALVAGTAVGLIIVALVYPLDDPWNGLFLLGGMGALLVTTHGLAHLVVGRAAGIRFTHWFLDGPTKVQPGLKTDYASYLRAPARSRAWMHASGALVTKAVPFALLGTAWAADVPGWTWAIMIAVGLIQIGTDILYSRKLSDWKRFRREMRIAREASPSTA